MARRIGSAAPDSQVICCAFCYPTSMRDDLVIEHRVEPSAGAFFIEQGGKQVAELFYTRSEDVAIIEHTQVDESLRGRGVAKRLVDAAVAWARKDKKKLAPVCPYAKRVFATHPELADVFSS